MAIGLSLKCSHTGRGKDKQEPKYESKHEGREVGVLKTWMHVRNTEKEVSFVSCNASSPGHADGTKQMCGSKSKEHLSKH